MLVRRLSSLVRVILTACLLVCPGGCRKGPALTNDKDMISQPAEQETDCPEPGHELLLCREDTVKLLEAGFFRTIGTGDKTARAAPGKVYCVVQLEWVAAGEIPPPPPRLVDGSGTTLPVSQPALTAYLDMQPDNRFMDRRDSFNPDALEAIVFEFDDRVAMSGLFLSWQHSCGHPEQPVQYCLGKRVFK